MRNRRVTVLSGRRDPIRRVGRLSDGAFFIVIIARISYELFMSSKTLSLDSTGSEAERMEAAIRHCVLEMDRARKRMKQDQAKIERIKAKTRNLLAELKAA